MQPTFLPWMGYFGYIPQVDYFVFLDDFSTSPRSWQQRNRLFVASNRVDWVTVPIKISGNRGKPLNEMHLSENDVWRRKLKLLLSLTYARAPHVHEVTGCFDAWLSRNQPDLATLNIEFIEEFSSRLGLGGQFIRSSTLGIIGLRRSERLLAILKALRATSYLAAGGSFGYLREDGVLPTPDICTVFHHFDHPTYSQIHSREFVSHLSILDAIANIGFSGASTLIRNSIRSPYQWNEMSELDHATGFTNDSSVVP